MAKVAAVEQDGKAGPSRLESVYVCHGASIYTLCLRLLADEKAAESAVAAAFVEFSKEMVRQSDELPAFARLRELAFRACRNRLRTKGLWRLKNLMQAKRIPTKAK